MEELFQLRAVVDHDAEVTETARHPTCIEDGHAIRRINSPSDSVHVEPQKQTKMVGWLVGWLVGWSLTSLFSINTGYIRDDKQTKKVKN